MSDNVTEDKSSQSLERLIAKAIVEETPELLFDKDAQSFLKLNSCTFTWEIRNEDDIQLFVSEFIEKRPEFVTN